MLQRCVVLKIVVANRLAQNNGKASLYKKCAACLKFFFLLITPVLLLIFTVLVVFTEFLVLHDYIFSWSIYKLYN